MKTLNNVFRLLLLLTAISTPLTSNADEISDMLLGVTDDTKSAVTANVMDVTAQEVAISEIVSAAVTKYPAKAADIAAAAAKVAQNLAAAITRAAVQGAKDAGQSSSASAIATAVALVVPSSLAPAVVQAASAVVPLFGSTIASDVTKALFDAPKGTTTPATTTVPTTVPTPVSTPVSTPDFIPPSSENTVAAVAQTAAIIDVISKTAAVKFATETATNACATSSDPGCFTKQYSKDLAAETKAVETALISKTSDSATTTTAVDNVHAAVSPN